MPRCTNKIAVIKILLEDLILTRILGQRVHLGIFTPSTRGEHNYGTCSYLRLVRVSYGTPKSGTRVLRSISSGKGMNLSPESMYLVDYSVLSHRIAEIASLIR